MKKFKSISFAERGYGYFPYLIVRLRAGLYQQIPIHRKGIENSHLEGLFLEENEIKNKHTYELACKKVFKGLGSGIGAIGKGIGGLAGFGVEGEEEDRTDEKSPADLKKIFLDKYSI